MYGMNDRHDLLWDYSVIDLRRFGLGGRNEFTRSLCGTANKDPCNKDLVCFVVHLYVSDTFIPFDI